MPHLKTKDGIQWHYVFESNKGRPVLLFIHGWGVDKRIWRQQTKVLSEHYQILSFDLPGHGQSTWKKVAFEQMARDLNELLQQLRIKQCTIIGSSLGGLLGIKFYGLFPEKVSAFVFVGSMPKFAKSKDYPYGLDIGQMRKLAGQLNSAYPNIIDIFFRSLFTKQERASRRFKWLQRFRRDEQKPMKPALAEYLDVLENEDLRGIFEHIKVPVQFFNGEGDTICCPNAVNYLKELMPQARFDVFKECGHFPFLSKPYEFNQMLKDYLNDVT